MSTSVHVVLASRTEEGLQTINQSIQNIKDINAERLLLANGHVDPLSGLHEQPDVLILHSAEAIENQLKALAARAPQGLPPIIVYGQPLPPTAVRFAIRAGVRDILDESEPLELARSLAEIIAELQNDVRTDEGQILAVINAKGGSGATFIATNLAHLSATDAENETVVIDLDFQFGSLPHYLDVTPKHSLLEALAQATELDRIAIEAFTATHPSGLSVMAPLPDVHTEMDFDVSERMRYLLPILRARYDSTVIDVPRHIDEVSSPVLQQADHILIVLQQSLPSVRDAVRLKTTLVRDMGINTSRVHAVLNRHMKAGSIDVPDICEALGEDKLMLIPNHFKSVGEAIEMGVPIAEVAANSPIVKSLVSLRKKLIPSRADRKGTSLAKGNTAIERLKQWSPF